MRAIGFLLIALLGLAACKEEVAEAPPPPVEMTEHALSHFCQMNISEHGGPKGQIHLAGLDNPLFFAQVRDLVAYLKSPERDYEVIAIYVSDMGVAPSWALPGTSNWIAAEEAVFVVGAPVAGGMGAPEVIPFAKADDAETFISQYGGEALALTAIPDDVLGPIDLTQPLETPL